MDNNNIYAFPLFHRIGIKIRSVINSRYWLWIVMGLAILLYLPLLFSGFYADDLGHRLTYSPEAAAKLGWPEDMAPDWWNLYGFSTHGEQYYDMLLDQGFFYPWWASRSITVSFFRPLASATLALDYWLWTDSPLPIHIHSLLWFLLLIFLVFKLYNKLSGSVTAAGLGILLIVLDDVFTNAAGWISNRHSLIAMVFGVLCIMLYHRGVEEKKWGLIGGSYGLMVVALLSSEMGLLTFAYLFAHMVVLEQDTWIKRMLRIAPFVVIIVIWRLIYSWLGYGVHGGTLYVDPINSPAQFISSMAIRLPINLFTTIGIPLADMTIAATPQVSVSIAIFSVVAVVLYAVLAFPVLKEHRLPAFWTIGVLCALVPISAGIPSNRNLIFISLGVMGLASQLLVDVVKMEKDDLAGLWRVMLKIHVPVLLVLYMVISPITILTQSSSWQISKERGRATVDFGVDPALAEQHVYIVNPSGVALYTLGAFDKIFTEQPIPQSLNYLSSSSDSVEITRIDDHTIHVIPEDGYLPPPGMVVDPVSGTLTPIHEENVYRTVDISFYYDPNHLNEVGQTVTLSQFTVEVAALTDDGRIAEALFTFVEPLEYDQYVWLVFDKVAQSYHRVAMPPVGESRVYP